MCTQNPKSMPYKLPFQRRNPLPPFNVSNMCAKICIRNDIDRFIHAGFSVAQRRGRGREQQCVWYAVWISMESMDVVSPFCQIHLRAFVANRLENEPRKWPKGAHIGWRYSQSGFVSLNMDNIISLDSFDYLLLRCYSGSFIDLPFIIFTKVYF